MGLNWDNVIGGSLAIPADHPNPDKAATAARDTLRLMGVEIASRYGKQAELAEMAEMVAALPADLRHSVIRLWCNSKVGHSFTVDVDERHDVMRITQQIGTWLEQIACRVAGGHNGIWVGTKTRLDARWIDAR